MKRFGGIGLKRVLAYGGLSALLLALAPGAQAERAELEKEDETRYFWDKNSVKAVPVSRYAWTLMDLNKATKAPNGENYQSAMTRWRVYCKTDMAVKLSVSYFNKPQGKGREVATQDDQEWRIKEAPIRPGTYLAVLKKEICDSAG